MLHIYLTTTVNLTWLQLQPGVRKYCPGRGRAVGHICVFYVLKKIVIMNGWGKYTIPYHTNNRYFWFGTEGIEFVRSPAPQSHRGSDQGQLAIEWVVNLTIVWCCTKGAEEGVTDRMLWIDQASNWGAVEICQKRPRTGCVIPHCKLQNGIT